MIFCVFLKIQSFGTSTHFFLKKLIFGPKPLPCNTKRINGLFCRLYRKVLVLLKNRKKQKCSHNAGKFEDRDFGDVPSTGVLENHIFLVFKILKKSFLVRWPQILRKIVEIVPETHPKLPGRCKIYFLFTPTNFWEYGNA